MPHKFEDPQDPHDPHQSDHLPCLPDDLKVLETLEDEREVEGDNGKQVNQVHRALDELELVGADDQADKVLQREEHHHEVVDEVDDVGEDLILDQALVILLKLLTDKISMKRPFPDSPQR